MGDGERTKLEHDAAWNDAAKAIRGAFPDRAEALLAILEKSCPRCAGGHVISRDAVDKLGKFAGKVGPGGIVGALAGALAGAALGSAGSEALLPAARSRSKKGGG